MIETGGSTCISNEQIRCDTAIQSDILAKASRLSCRQFEDPDEPKEITLRFSVITEYADPNFENRYPAELTIATDPVTISARFGDTVRIIVHGGRDSGYWVELAG